MVFVGYCLFLRLYGYLLSDGHVLLLWINGING